MTENKSLSVNADEVDPIKSLKDIAKVKQYLIGKVNKGDYMLFPLSLSKSHKNINPYGVYLRSSIRVLRT